MKTSQASIWPSFFLSAGVLCAMLCAAGTAGAAKFVFATFKGDPLADEKLVTYDSTDALNFKLVSETGFSGPTGALRDPSILRYADGKYYVAYTDPVGAGCCGKEDHFSIAQSTDLVHWTNLAQVPAAVPGVAHVWAPEWFVEGSTVNIIANIDTLNNDSDFKPYIFTARDRSLAAWSGPVAMGIGPNYIDTFVLKLGSTYHAFTKNESTRYLEHATATKLTGPWNFIGKADWAGWGSGMEGPTVVQLDDGSWRMFLDPQQAGYFYTSSPDLVTWTKTAPLPGLSSVVRHGTVIRDTPIGDAGGSGGSGGASGNGAVSSGASGSSGVNNTSAGASGRSGSAAAGASEVGGTTSPGGATSGGSASAAPSGGTANGGTPLEAAGSSAGGQLGAPPTSGLGGSVAASGASGASGSSGSGAIAPGAATPAQSSGCSCEISRPATGLGRLWLAGLLAGFVLRSRRRVRETVGHRPRV